MINIKQIKRLNQILGVLVKYELHGFAERLDIVKHLPLSERLSFAKGKSENRGKSRSSDHSDKGELSLFSDPVMIRRIFEELDGSFLKLGQLLSLRPDLIPQEYCDELSKLQDSVKPTAVEDIKRVIESELKKPLSAVFNSFESRPIASASVAQTHKAKIGGKDVILKVQRPGIKEIFDIDIELMYSAADMLQKHYDFSIVDLRGIVDEFKRYTNNEFDFIREAQNINRFRKHFERYKNIVIPAVMMDRTTSKLLCMELIDGVSVNRHRFKNDAERKAFVKNLADMMLKQIFIDGLFHGDPHPANILITGDGKIAFIDFGIVGYIDAHLKDKLSSFFVALMNYDLEGIASSLINLNMVDKEVNEELLKEDIYDALSEYYDLSLDKINISSALKSVIRIAKKNSIKLPSNFVLLAKALVTLESVCSQVYPKFSMMAMAKPFASKLAKSSFGVSKLADDAIKAARTLKDFILDLPEQSFKLVSRVREADDTIKSVDNDIKVMTSEMDKSSNRVSVAMIMTGLIIGASLAMDYGSKWFLGLSNISIIGYGAAFVLAIVLIASVIREKRAKR